MSKNNKAGDDNEDKENILLFLSGDEKGFDKLLLKYQDKVFNICLRYFNNAEDAIDAVQETYIKMYRFIKDFKFKSGFTTWLYRITVNTCKNKYNSRAFRNAKKSISLDNPDTSLADYKLTNTQTPEQCLEKKERLNIILSELSRMPDKFKKLIILRDTQNLSYEEIVQITGMKLGTVKSTLAKARMMLRDRLFKESKI